MISDTLRTAINDQIAKEFHSSYLYLSMAAHFDGKALPGFGSWMKTQSREEWGHGMRFYEYLYEVGATATLEAIPKPKADFGSPLEIFQEVLEHERKVTDSINRLFALARKEGDAKSELMLQWFVNEQVEEEKNARDIIDKLEMSGGTPFGLMFLDQHVMGARKGT